MYLVSGLMTLSTSVTMGTGNGGQSEGRKPGPKIEATAITMTPAFLALVAAAGPLAVAAATLPFRLVPWHGVTSVITADVNFRAKMHTRHLVNPVLPITKHISVYK